MTTGLYPMHMDLNEVRQRGRQVARHLQNADWALPAVFGLHLSGDVGGMVQEIEYLRAELAVIRDRRTDPALLRWCDWPGCWRSYDATTGPVDDPGWMRQRRAMALLCPDHDPAGHRPDFTWTPDDAYITARCECGAVAEVQPTTQQAVLDWWSAHVSAATQ